MTRFLRKAPCLGALSLLLLGMPALAQEADKDHPEKKSLWQSLQDKGKSVLHDAEDAVEDAAQTAVKEAKEKYFPILREAGYEVTEIHLTFSLAPGVTLRATRLADIGPKRRLALLEKYVEDSYATAVLRTVFLAERVEVEGLELTALHLTLGLHPQVTAVLHPTGT